MALARRSSTKHPTVQNQPQRRGDRLRFPTSLDRLRLFMPFEVAPHLPNFHVFTAADFPFLSAALRRRDVRLYQEYGQNVYGIFSHWRDNYLRVRIALPFSRSGKVLCWLTFNPSRLLYGTNTHPLSALDLERALEEARVRLKQQGLHVDIKAAGLSQVDVCRDVALPRSTEHYWSLLHHMDTAYNSRSRNFESGMWRGSKSVKLCLYDKQKEVTFRAALFGDAQKSRQFLPGIHTLRLEWRLLDAQAVKRHLAMGTAQELLENYETLPDHLSRYLKKTLMREPPPATMALPVRSSRLLLREEWKELLQVLGGQESHVKNLLAIYGYERLAREVGWEAADRLLWGAAVTSQAKPSLTKMRRHLRQWRLLYLRSPQGIPYAQLYVELYRATFALKTDDDAAQDRDFAELLPVETPKPRRRRPNRRKNKTSTEISDA